VRRWMSWVILSLFLAIVGCTLGCGGRTPSYLPSQYSSSIPSHRLQSMRADASDTSVASPDYAAEDSTPAPAEGHRAQAKDKSDNDSLLFPHYVYLSWNASPPPVSGYNIYRGTSPTGPFAKLNSTIEPATVYTDYAVKAGTQYFYVLTAVNANNESGFSSPISATIPTP